MQCLLPLENKPFADNVIKHNHKGLRQDEHDDFVKLYDVNKYKHGGGANNA